MNLIQLLQAILPATILSQLDHTLEIKGLVTDNRDVEDSDCFIALAGITHHGKQDSDDAVRRGARVV
jgi:UDP-N-acetylmuramyl tripeptide synthase